MEAYMQLINSSNLFQRLELNGHSRTAINTGIQASGHSLSKIREQFTGPALIISLDKDPSKLTIEETPIEQFLSSEKQLYIVLHDYFSGNSLQNYLAYSGLDPQKREFIHLMAMIINSHSSLLPAQINPNHILHDSDKGRIFLLPGEWSRIISAHELESSREKGFDQLNYPDVEGFEARILQTHFLAGLLYFMLSGKWAVESDDMHFQHRLKRMKIYRPIEAQFPQMPAALADWFYRALRMEASDCSPLLSYLDYLDELRSGPISEPESNSPRLQSYQKALGRELLRVKIKTRAGLIIALLSVLIAVSAFGITAIRQATRSLAITGMPPEEVLENFYESYNNLDHVFMSEATHRRAGRGKVNQIASIYAISTIREGTEMRKVFLSAPEWLNMPEDDRKTFQDYLVFGITDLSITATPRAEQTRFIVSYTLWSPEEGLLNGENFTEQVELREFRRGWKIVSLETVN